MIEIIKKSDILCSYSIDFGFEGYEPPDMMTKYFPISSYTLYIENYYNKLQINLTKNEYLYIYYDTLKENDIEINYINNSLINTNYKYNFKLIHKNQNTIQKKFIFSNLNDETIRLIINQYNPKPPYCLKINYGDNASIYHEKNVELFYNQELNKNRSFEFSFESDNDLIISYSYEDDKDDFIKKEGNKWEKDRIQYNNLTINNIKAINETKIKINFKTNYLNSLTKYIIIVSSEEKNNNFENMKNILFLINLIKK